MGPFNLKQFDVNRTHAALDHETVDVDGERIAFDCEHCRAAFKVALREERLNGAGTAIALPFPEAASAQPVVQCCGRMLEHTHQRVVIERSIE